MTRKLILAPFTARDITGVLLSRAIDLLPAGRSEHDYSGIAYLTPNPGSLADSRRRFADMLDQRAFIPPMFTSPGLLARDLFAESGTGRLLDAGLRPLVIRSLMSSEETPVSLGYARAVAAFISEIKRHVVPAEIDRLPARLEEWLADYDRPRERALQALKLMKRYDALLQQRGWLDPEDVLRLAIGQVREHIRPSVLVLDGFTAPEPLEQELLAALIQAAVSTVALTWGNGTDESEYKHPARFTEFMSRQTPRFKVEILGAAQREEPVLRRFPTIEEEVIGIARDIKRRFLARELSLADTVLAFPNLDRYALLVARILDRYGIPHRVQTARPLAASPPVIAVLELLRALDTDYERLAFSAALGSPFLPGLLRLPSDENHLPRDAAARRINLDSRRAGIIKGRVAWRNIGNRIIAAGKLERRDREAAFDLQARVRQALDLVDRLLPRSGRIADCCHELTQFLEAAGFSQSTEPGTDPRRLYDTLDSLAELDRVAGLRDTGFAGFVSILSFLLGHEPAFDPPRHGGVSVLGIRDTLGLEPRHLYVGGLTEEDLPSGYPPDTILPDFVRSKLDMLDIDRHRDWENFNLLRTVNSPPEPAFLSFHDSDADSIVLPTPFLDAATRKTRRTADVFSPEELQHSEGARHGARLAERDYAVDFHGDTEVARSLSARYGPKQSISVSRLESYRRCPYRFYIEHVLGIEPLPEPAYEIDAAQWGMLVHRVFEDLYSKGPVDLEAIPDRSRAALERALKEADLPEFWAQVTRRVLENILPVFVDTEAAMRAEGFLPTESEARIRGEPARGLRIHGRLDRVDASRDSLRVIDYKTGSTTGISGRAVTMDRTHMQLPLYARLLQDMHPGRSIDNMGVWSVRDGEVTWLARRDYTVEGLIGAAVTNARAAIAAIRKGRFAVDEIDETACRNCDLGFLCGRHMETGG